jgi:gliding motility-associated-like protein
VICDTVGCTTSWVIFTVIDTSIQLVPVACDIDTIPMNSPDTIHVFETGSILPKPAIDTVLSIHTEPLNGSATVDGNKAVIYVPSDNYKGTDEFSYKVCVNTGPYNICDTATICITVVDTSHNCFIPDGFSPNGDNVNDLYVIPCNDMYPKATLKVFSRWGDQVWDSNGPYQNNWNGRNQDGVICPTGTYFIIYDYNDGVHKSIAKFVVINR